ncbi:hypothetical protein JW859_09375 [bacterium]|nr:hypothetical protein [bacterium]
MAIHGVWYNRMGSELHIETDGDMIYGTYATRGEGGYGDYKVTGRMNNDPSRNGLAVGFIVVWHNNYINRQCVTSWSGQYQNINGFEEMPMSWVLTQVTDDADNWHSQMIGYDVFLREPPTPEEIAARSRRGPASHPRERRVDRPTRRESE